MVFYGFRRWAASAVLAAAPLTSALAQDFSPPATPAVRLQPDPIETLSAYLRTLAATPRDYAALIGAGNAALQVGDPNAALGFFARAEQVDSKSGKAKAGLASALVALERPNDALPLFAQALSLGVSESDIARDRGLAYDLRGDTALAQRDYALAMTRSADDETVRRYALSLGISGQRAEAMTLLAPLLLKKDQSAWRARSFILAMTGDLPGANGIARQVMPANLAAAMTPFLNRLATLNPADRAHAVNFGTIPTNGAQMATVQIGDPFLTTRESATASRNADARGFTRPGTGQRIGTGLIPAGEALGPRPAGTNPPSAGGSQTVTAGTSAMVAASPAPLPRASAPTLALTLALTAPSATTAPMAAAGPPAIVAARPVPIVTADPATRVAEAIGGPSPSIAAGAAVAARAPAARPNPLAPAFANEPTRAPAVAALPSPLARSMPGMATDTASAPPVTARSPEPGLIGPPVSSATVKTGPAVPIVTAPVAVTTPGPQAPLPQPGFTTVASDTPRLASVLNGVTPESEPAAVALPSPEEIRAQRQLIEKRNRAAAARAAADDAEKASRAAEAAKASTNPARLWVQVATGNNTAGLGRTWARIRSGNELAFKGKTAYSVPFRATNRLIVGPMKSAGDARALVGALAKSGLSATTFSSEAGQEVARISAK